ncbi:mitochondrial fission ELM1 family protein [Vulcaniibacterium gelatinicum]|uniref:mitochondrial fission ELM1 family protein n=1 Tax=Vulcaniibacterium gelatinicum TaxID=2598725 RepID=UPI0011CBC4C3|nr:mitochondrial fission ELM1 family protein [Vulcaniibacterium gelatinicum]
MQRSAAEPVTLCVHDGRAGNARQALALGRALDPAPGELVLRPRAPWRWAAPRALPLAARGFDPALAPWLAAPPALAIGCGRQAALATRLLRAHGGRGVQILDPRLDPRAWNLVVVPEHDALRGDNVLTLVGSLHPVDEAWLAQARADFDVLAQLPSPRITLLVGGPSRHAPLDASGFEAALAALEAVLRAEGGSLLATTSRRTPESWATALRHRLAGIPGVRWFGDGGTDNPYPGMLAFADRIVATPDSVNMLSEACATQAPVYLLAAACVRGRRLPRFHAQLGALGRVRPFAGSLEAFPVQPLRETARIAAEVRARLGLPA